MDKNEWQKKWGLDDQEMAHVVEMRRIVGGSVDSVMTVDERNEWYEKKRKEGIERILEFGFPKKINKQS